METGRDWLRQAARWPKTPQWERANAPTIDAMILNKNELHPTQALLARQIEETLLERYGLILGGVELAKTLGYPSMRAFQQAINRGVVGVPVFPMEKRRGRFALASDVAEWLAKQRSRAQ